MRTHYCDLSCEGASTAWCFFSQWKQTRSPTTIESTIKPLNRQRVRRQELVIQRKTGSRPKETVHRAKPDIARQHHLQKTKNVSSGRETISVQSAKSATPKRNKQKQNKTKQSKTNKQTKSAHFMTQCLLARATRRIVAIVYSAQHWNQHKDAFAWIFYRAPCY